MFTLFTIQVYIRLAITPFSLTQSGILAGTIMASTIVVHNRT